MYIYIHKNIYYNDHYIYSLPVCRIVWTLKDHFGLNVILAFYGRVSPYILKIKLVLWVLRKHSRPEFYHKFFWFSYGLTICIILGILSDQGGLDFVLCYLFWLFWRFSTEKWQLKSYIATKYDFILGNPFDTICTYLLIVSHFVGFVIIERPEGLNVI